MLFYYNRIMTRLMDKLKMHRDIYCFEKSSLLYQLKKQGKEAKMMDVFKYNMFCENTRSKDKK